MTDRERELLLAVAEATASSAYGLAFAGPHGDMPAIVRWDDRGEAVERGPTLEAALTAAAKRLGAA